MKIYFLAFFLMLTVQELSAQDNPRYLILFEDKGNSPYSKERPEEYLSAKAISRRVRQNIAITDSDLPVSPTYLSAVQNTGAKVIAPSRWFNGAIVEASHTQLAAISALPFYKGTEGNHPILYENEGGVTRMQASNESPETTIDIDYGLARTQTVLLGADHFHQKNILGQGILIAAFDEGFSRADQLDYFKTLFAEKRIIDTYDFIKRETNVYDKQSHGTNVLSTIAAYQPGVLVGIAPQAQFVLYRTESNLMESPYEEVSWLLAAERSDSIGVDIITSSLGYTTFDGRYATPDYNYTYQDMDGRTAIVSRAARWATRKGILVVNSAGNEANNSWRYIVAPADVDSVLTVGATNTSLGYASFSSQGPNALGEIKPDLAAVGQGVYIGNNVGTGAAVSSSGTSFSCPQIAGLAALVWQSYPFLTAQEVIASLKKSGDQADNPDNYLGYGVPNLQRLELIVAAYYGPLAVEPLPKILIKSVPNPVQNPIVLIIPTSLKGQLANISIMSQNGLVLAQSEHRLEATTYVPTPSLAPGVYLLKVQTERQQQVIKIVKQ